MKTKKFFNSKDFEIIVNKLILILIVLLLVSVLFIILIA